MTLLILVFCIAFQIFLTSKKVSPFLSLLLVSILAGLSLGMETTALMKTIEKGVGNTLGGLLLIICLGAVLGKILDVSGAAETIANTLIKKFGNSNIQWSILLTGFLIGIPLYYTAGFVILIPLVYTVARKANVPLLFIALPMAASLSVTHCFLPPHPGPVLLVNSFKADMGLTLLYGLIIAIPAVIIGGPMLGKYFQNMKTVDSALFGKTEVKNETTMPSFLISVFIALLPVLLITFSVLANYLLQDGYIKTTILFFGDSTIALLLTVLIALYFFGVKNKISIDVQMNWISDAISGVAMILLIITAGGIFKQVLIDSGTADYISAFSSTIKMPLLIFAWLITAMLRVAVGSATVAGITAAGIVTPLIGTMGVSPELMVLSIGAGSVFGSHVNDSGFWMFKEYFGLSMKQTFMSWTVMESVISVIGLIGVLVLDLVV